MNYLFHILYSRHIRTILMVLMSVGIFFVSLFVFLPDAHAYVYCDEFDTCGDPGGDGQGVQIGYSVTPNTTPLGSSVVISWWSENASSCTSNGKDGFVISGTSGSKTITPSTLGANGYWIRCLSSANNANGTAETVFFDVNTYTPLSVSCSVTPSVITVGSSATWSASVSGGTTYTYSWSGTDGLSGTASTVAKQYTTAGTKSGQVAVTSGNQSVTNSCSNTLTVNIPSPTAQLSATPTTIDAGSSSVLAWSSANTNVCTGSGFSTGGATSGTVVVSPSATTGYSVTCSGDSINAEGAWVQSNYSFTKICSANNDPNSDVGETSIQQPFCEDVGGGNGASCTSGQIGQTCKSHGWEGIGVCAGEGTVYGHVYTYRCEAAGSSEEATASVTVTVHESQVPECSDGVDNDGDGATDSNDYGCSSSGGGGDIAQDPSESPNPQCSDGVDNNGNGLVDYPNDTVCTDFSDGNEEVVPEASLSLSGPSLIRSNTSVTLAWSVSNVQANSCTMSGTNGDSWVLSGSLGNQVSSPLTNKTIFVLSCTNLAGVQVSSETTVGIAPSFKEI